MATMKSLLPGNFRALTRQTERTLDPEGSGLSQVHPSDIYGGIHGERSSDVFLKILEGKGSQAQKDVVMANAALALYWMDESQGLDRLSGTGQRVACFRIRSA